MKINARFGNGEIEIVNKRWMTTSVDPQDCVSSRIQNAAWGFGMGIEGEDLSYLGEDFSEDTSVDNDAHFFFNGIYRFVRTGRMLFKNVSLEIVPSIGCVDSWCCDEAEITVVGGVVNDLDSSPEYGVELVRQIMIDFGYAYCDISDLKERYENDCASGECVAPFQEWLAEMDSDCLMNPDQLEEAEFDGPHWWYGDFMYSEVRDWIYEGVDKWKMKQLEHIRLAKSGNQ